MQRAVALKVWKCGQVVLACTVHRFPSTWITGACSRLACNVLCAIVQNLVCLYLLWLGKLTVTIPISDFGFNEGDFDVGFRCALSYSRTSTQVSH